MYFVISERGHNIYAITLAKLLFNSPLFATYNDLKT